MTTDAGGTPVGATPTGPPWTDWPATASWAMVMEEVQKYLAGGGAVTEDAIAAGGAAGHGPEEVRAVRPVAHLLRAAKRTTPPSGAQKAQSLTLTAQLLGVPTTGSPMRRWDK